MKGALISDCEGPISRNDNAFEITSHFVPKGDKIFAVISRYDDVLADITKKAGYRAGDTLKLILPFVKAYDTTDHEIRQFSTQNLILIPNIKDTLRYVREIAHIFIISTSYEHYIRALCQAIDFPYEDTYCTKLKIDECNMTREEKNRVKELAQEISQMPMIEIPSTAKSLKDLSEKHRDTTSRLGEIFWNEIADMESWNCFQKVNPVSGKEKADAVRNACEQVHVDLSDVIYVGDSITDVEALKLVRENDGLAVSFNGNRYAIRNAEIAVLSETSIVTAIIADVFYRFGKEQTLSLMDNWDRERLKRSPTDATLLNRLFTLHPKELPKVGRITGQNREILAEESSEFRKQVRGEAIGRLG